MKSAILKNKKVEIIEKEKPTLGTKYGAIIKVEGCGLCGSDIIKIKENKPTAVLGHEVVGEIIEIKTETPFKVGNKVALGHHYPCFECDFCHNENYSMCATFKKTNIEPCGFSEYIYVSEGHLKNTVFKITDVLTDVEASFLEPLACCIRAIRRANLNTKYPKNALVVGLGSIGLLMGQALREFNINSYGYDINPSRQKFADFFNIKFDKNIKYDAIFMTSGSDKAIKTAIDLIKDGGKIVVFSSVPTNLGYENNEIYYRELNVIGSYSPSPRDLELSYKMLSKRKIIVNNLSTFYPLDKINQAIKDTVENKILKAYIKI